MSLRSFTVALTVRCLVVAGIAAGMGAATQGAGEFRLNLGSTHAEADPGR